MNIHSIAHTSQFQNLLPDIVIKTVYVALALGQTYRPHVYGHLLLNKGRTIQEKKD